MRLRIKPFGLAMIAGVLLLFSAMMILRLRWTTTAEALPPEHKRETTRPSIGNLHVKRDSNSKQGARPEKRSLAAMLSNEGNFPPLTREQIDAYVDSRNRSLDSLLSAYRLNGDEAFLREALERFPNDPHTLVTALRLENDPGKRLEMLEALKRADPNNAIGNCMAARVLLAMGKKDEAFEELRGLSGKTFDDYFLRAAQNDEEAYLSSGVPAVEAKLRALYSQGKPQLLELRKLSTDMAGMRAAYRSAGDADSAEILRETQIGLGRQLQGGNSILDGLVGMVMEKEALKDLDSAEARVREQEIERQKKVINSGTNSVMELMKNPEVAESDWLLYFDRAKLFGEASANVWMQERYPAR